MFTEGHRHWSNQTREIHKSIANQSIHCYKNKIDALAAFNQF